MELWIRSQDKLLFTKIDYILVNGLDIFNQNQLIGTYSSYERALEVLEEIQGKITQNEALKTMMPSVSTIKGYEEKFGELFKKMVYEMPEE